MPTYRDKDAIRCVAAIGSGTIGSGWIAAFLGKGLAVRLHDPAPGAGERTAAHVAGAWDQMVELGLARAGDDWCGRLSSHITLADAVAGADFVQESTPEQAVLKRALFEQLADLAPADVLIGSSTSSLPISDMQRGLPTAGRFVLGHPFNPVHLIPLVEIGGGDETDQAAIDVADGIYTSLGKVTVRLNREVFGHIANRLASAMFREAVSLVADGYASVADVDRTIRYGPGLKWALQGQFTTYHTSGGPGGLADFLAKFTPGIIRRWDTMHDPALADPALQARLVTQMDAATDGATVAEVAQRQDAMLMALLKLLH